MHFFKIFLSAFVRFFKNCVFTKKEKRNSEELLSSSKTTLVNIPLYSLCSNPYVVIGVPVLLYFTFASSLAFFSRQASISLQIASVSIIFGSTWHVRNKTSTPDFLALSSASPNSGCVSTFALTSVIPSIWITKASIA